MSYQESLAKRATEAAAVVKSDPVKALKIVLNEMPVRAKKVVETGKPTPEQLKAAQTTAAKNVIGTLCQVDSPKLAAAIAGLNDEEIDTLMKFVYRGFSEDYDYTILLKAHEEICKKNGNGPIIRAIHTRLEV